MNLIKNLLSSWGISNTYIPFLSFLFSFVVIICVAYLAHILFKIYLSKQLSKYFETRKTSWGKFIIDGRIIHRFSHLVPALIIYSTVPLLAAKELSVDHTIIRIIQAVMLLYILTAFLLVFNSLVYIIEHLHKAQKKNKRKTITSYIQVLKISVYFCAAILAVSIILEKSPVALFAGLGVAAAAISFVFKDTIICFFAGIQLSSYDLVGVGDWIVLPKYEADGDVIEININTVKIQNFDKSITTVPTSALLTDGMTNLRGMEEAGGRRIKRSIHIDIKSVKFCDEVLLKELMSLHLVKSNQENGNSLTNLGLFRSYVKKYIDTHPKIHKDMTRIIRHLEPTELGLPLEVYAFTNDTNWSRYEDIQSEIFEHLLPTMKLFELEIYQR
jgi:miniconductance mechanosensitive channel